MNQIVITKKANGNLRVIVMGHGRTEESFTMDEKLLADNLLLLLAKLAPSDDL